MDKSPNNPIDIARLTLKQLAYSKVPPTPDNFRKVYDDIAGIKTHGSDCMAITKIVESMLRDAGNLNSQYINLSKNFRYAVERDDWLNAEKVLRSIMPEDTGNTIANQWQKIFSELIKHLKADSRQHEFALQFSALERMMVEHQSDPNTLVLQLDKIVKSMGKGLSANHLADDSISIKPLEKQSSTNGIPLDSKSGASSMAILWRDLLIEALELGLLSQFKTNPELERKTRVLLDQARASKTESEVSKLGTAFKSYWRKLESTSAVQTHFNQALMQLLKLLVENMLELANGDGWIQAQVAIIQEVMNKPPSIKTLQEAEVHLQALTARQSALKQSIMEAKAALKEMAVSCIDLLGSIAHSSADHHAKIVDYQEAIESSNDIIHLNEIMGSLRQDMAHIQADALRTYEELKESHERVIIADQMIEKLSLELDEVSDLAAKDFLTGVMNRRGADEALEREFARASRSETPICVSLLDIDHFKSINDQFGHDIGDNALVHLVEVAKSALRPSDQIARFGGEEFLIALPETSLEEAEVVLTRVQRELTRNLFMHNNQRTLITFSAGVAQRRGLESVDEVLIRADNALYKAKHSGRNRVVGA